MGLVVLDLDPAARAHLRRAIEAYARRCRENGVRLPAALSDLAFLATTGQERTNIDHAEDVAHDGHVTTLLTFAEVAERLRVSERTVRRLVSDGSLPAVEVASKRRVHTADLDAYAEGLRQRPGRVPA